MANTTLANLKKKALQKVHAYNSGDSAGLELAGGIINDCLSYIQAEIKGSIFEHALGNSVNTTAAQAYVDLTDTDILEIISVYQTTTDTKLRRLTLDEFRKISPDTTVYSGVPEFAYFPTQVLSASGVNIWRIYLINTPDAVIALSYDYIKSLTFSADDTSADAEYCKLPRAYDTWIYAEFKPRYVSILDPANTARYQIAELEAKKARDRFKSMIMGHSDRITQVARMSPQYRDFDVATTPTPT